MTSILFSSPNGNRPRVLVVTSAGPKEGKSTVTSNLAVALAEINQRVLLIDGDMRLPRMHDIFELQNTFGLSDILRDRTPIEQYTENALVQKTLIPRLCVLPAGASRTSLSRLLYSPRLKELLARFRSSFDIILIDSAPVLSVPDSRILARAADAVILVFRAHKTTQDAAMVAVRCFAQDGSPVLGTILNDWNPDVSGHEHYAYGAYHSQHHQSEPEA